MIPSEGLSFGDFGRWHITYGETQRGDALHTESFSEVTSFIVSYEGRQETIPAFNLIARDCGDPEALISNLATVSEQLNPNWRRIR